MLLMKILIAINILYLIIEDFRTKTVSIYYCISLFTLSTTYAIFSNFNIVCYLNNFIIWNIIFWCLSMLHQLN